ncbi:LCP family protein [Frankia sp. CNm7]|uniref:LCP family protein n=1 Tax=Frankia nepalensis TaxID=1836974 RepID=A0A937UMC5_9ACTN|nr:LCP family protein [Frankia nepalensis]MBL7496823.1 LCP family protein [Frankia nepalensis]MBL7510966.1 LCP family protein [Frankia nepalensis]MBL7522558.1 LCP family protein [Frankia nepalensis]MBL7626923.1 LCP family protein [Frankia nepalensis]
MSRVTMERPLPPGLSPRTRRRSSLRRISLASFGLLSVLVFLLSSVGWYFFHQLDGNITRLKDWDGGGDKPAEVPGDLNILLLGDDSREGTGDQYGGDAVQGMRSDTTIIAHFDADGSLTLLSFPRDTLVTVGGDGAEGIPRDGKLKLTEVLNYGGLPTLVSTMQDLTGLAINHVITINLAGFKQMTDAIGGVDVCVLPGNKKEWVEEANAYSTNTKDPMSGWVGGPGTVHVNGELALAFVRQRHGLPNDDKDRIRRQQQFLSKLLAKATSSGVLSNPVKINSLLGAVGKSMQTDLDAEGLVELAKRASGLDAGKIKFITVPTHVPMPPEGGATNDRGNIPPHGEVLLLNTEDLETILAPMRAEPEEDPTLASAPPVDPSQVSVAAVVNASGRSGLAAQTAKDLAALGFVGAMETGNTTLQAPTEVRYPTGQEGPAKTLAGKIPGARAVPDTALAGTGLKLVLGSSFTGVDDATGAGAGTATPGATSSAQPGAGAGPTATTPPPDAGNDTSCTY